MPMGRRYGALAMVKLCIASWQQLIPKEAAGWFKSFFQGLDDPLFFPYTESENFENPVSFRLDSFADDASTRHLYSIMIRPCFLPVGMSTSNRIIKPGYESYQPVARQLGLGQVPPHFFLHHLTSSRAELPDILTGQRCYTFFDALAIPIPHNLCFTTTTDGFDTWWSMWKTHAFRRALGPLLRQLDAEYDIPAHQEQDGPEPTQINGSPFTLLPPAPVVLFCQNSPALKKINEISSGDGEEVPMPSVTLDLAASTSVAGQVANLAKLPEKPIVTSSAAPLSLGEGCDLSSLLAFDPESIEPAISKGRAKPWQSMVRSSIENFAILLSRDLG
ncbi:hypothetical protein QYE76_036772 [Lolium multiflorum]|uniref:Uncharacterized protein n=1 Tax=Lolium multiflorum TaxID=4521 RepID=A0AAD8VNE0_LOLMU|nr:hypothetical protein QYE76_036772 [Lolium multiflorum]